jgi:TRAP-type C4-dicarboxylate transport system permease large subunit
VVAGVRPDVPLPQIFRGVWPFVIADLVCVLMFTLFPGIVTFLPNLMMAR